MNVIDDKLIESGYLLALKGYSNEIIAQKLGFSLRSFFRYKVKSKQFARRIMEGREKFNKYKVMKFCNDNKIDYSFFEKDFDSQFDDIPMLDDYLVERTDIVRNGVAIVRKKYIRIIPTVEELIRDHPL